MLQESNRVELKENLNDKLEKEIVAFLNNHEGGVLYIGVDDAGNPIQLPDLDSLQLKIADRIKNNILPSTLGLFDIVTEVVDGISVTKVIISSGLEKPYYIKNKGKKITYFIFRYSLDIFIKLINDINSCNLSPLLK